MSWYLPAGRPGITATPVTEEKSVRFPSVSRFRTVTRASGDHASRRVRNRNVQSGQLLCGKLDGTQQGSSEKAPDRAKNISFHSCSHPIRRPPPCQEADIPRNPTLFFECRTPYLRLTGGSNITKALEMAAASPCSICSMLCCAERRYPCNP